MIDFHKALEETELNDVGYVGPKFMWWNKTNGQWSIHLRIDRGVTSPL